MPDMIQPVGAMIKAPDPNQAFGTMSSILGLQQQRQALQTGQYQQQTAQAGAITAQQGAKEVQAGAKLLADPVGNGLVDENGNPTKDSYSIIKSVMPTTGDDNYQSLLKTAKGHIEFRDSVQNLSQNEQGYVSSRLAGIAADPDAHISDVLSGVDALKTQFKGTAEEDSINRLVGVIKGAVDDAGDKHGMDGVRKVVNGFSRGAVGNAGITGPGGITNPTATTMQGRGGLQPIQTNPMAPGGIQKIGAPLEQGLAPTEKIPYKGAAAAATSGAASRASGVAGSDIDRANQISANVKPAQAGIQTTQQIDDLADQIHSGKFAGWLSKQAATVGVSEATYARQLLEKDLGIIKTQMTTSASSDSRAATILSGTPEATSDPQTIHGAMDYVRGSFRQNLEQGKNLSAYREKHPDLSGFQGADDHFTSTGGPLVHEFLSLKGKDQQSAFYRRNFSSPQEALKFRNEAFAASHTLGLDDANNR
jgi:hypothetical protein